MKTKLYDINSIWFNFMNISRLCLYFVWALLLCVSVILCCQVTILFASEITSRFVECRYESIIYYEGRLSLNLTCIPYFILWNILLYVILSCVFVNQTDVIISSFNIINHFVQLNVMYIFFCVCITICIPTNVFIHFFQIKNICQCHLGLTCLVLLLVIHQ